MIDLRLTPLIFALLLPAAAAAQHVHPVPADSAGGGGHAMQRGVAPLGLPAARDGSGTSWLPDLTPMRALHASASGWELMLHGNLHLQYISQGSDRGRDQLGSINWLMGMARRPLLGGELGLRAMLSAEPWTIGGCGYPILLATGEICDGNAIVDEQHPHDLFMELAAEYRRALGQDVALQLYAAPVGEPALGPVAFPHRTSAFPNPLAPVSHHWFDATHIAFGVATLGVYGQRWKVEGSLFNGREPDEERTDLDLGPLDSYAGRVWWLPSERWAVQLSGARLTEAEPGHDPADPRVDVTRYTASLTHHRLAGQNRVWATTLAAGRNVEEGTGTVAYLLESSLALSADDHLFTRAEWAEKTAHDLALHDRPGSEVFGVAQLSGGYARDLATVAGLRAGLGLQGAVSFLPAALEPYYGARNPLGFSIFASLRPAAMSVSAEGMEGPASPAAPPGNHDGHTM